MDAQLAEAGQRWREANSAAASVDFDRVQPVLPSHEIPLEFPGPPRRSAIRPWQWMAGAAGLAAVVVGLAVGLRPGSGGHHAAVGDHPPRPALLGTSWTLANLTPDGGRTTKALNHATISFATNGKVASNDGCAPFSSTSARPSPRIVGSAASSTGDAHGTVIFGTVGMAAIGCVDVELMSQLDLFDKIVMSPEPATWTIYGSGKLVLERDGVGTLVFVRGAVEPDRAGSPLVGSAWRLDTIEQGDSASAYDWVGNPPHLDLASDGTVDGYDGCDPIRGTYAVDEATLSLQLSVTTTTACTNGYSGTIDSVLTAPKIHWQVSGSNLLLTAGGTTLAFGRE